MSGHRSRVAAAAATSPSPAPVSPSKLARCPLSPPTLLPADEQQSSAARISAYLSSRAALASATAASLRPAAVVPAGPDHRPPSAAFDEWIDAFHGPDAKAVTQQHGSRRAAYIREHARAKRLRARQLGQPCDSSSEEEDTTEAAIVEAAELPAHEQAERRRAAREQRRVAEREKAAAEEQRRAAEQQFSLLASFNSQMKAAETAQQADLSFPTAAAILVTANASARPVITAPSPVASPASHTPIAPSPTLGAGANTFLLPIVLPGAPPFHFDPTAHSTNGRGSASTRPPTRAEERRQKAAFEKEKRELVAFLLGRPEAPPTTGPTPLPPQPSEPPLGGLTRITEEVPRAMSRAAGGTASPRKTASSLSPRRSVVFRAPASPPPRAPPALLASASTSKKSTSIVPVASSSSAAARAIRTTSREMMTNAADARMLASMTRRGSTGSSSASGSMLPARTLSLEHKRAVEKERRARQLFQQVCGGLLGQGQDANQQAGSTFGRVDEPKFGFGLELSVEELARNAKQEQRLIRGLTGSVAGEEDGDSSAPSSPRKVFKFAVTGPGSHSASHSDLHGGDASQKDAPTGTETMSSIVASSKDGLAADGKDGGADDQNAEDEEAQEKGRKDKRAAAAAQAAGEYSPVSPELVNALIKATKRGDATMVATLIAQVPPDQRLEFINMGDKNGSTAIFHTVWPGHLFALRCLLEAGADPNIQNVKLNTALHLACERGHLNLIRCLLEHKADWMLLNYESKPCFSTPAKEEDRIVMERFIKNTAAEVKRGAASNFKLAMPNTRPKDDPFHPRFYRAHGFQAAEARTLQAATLVASDDLRDIMAHQTPIVERGLIQGSPVAALTARPPTTPFMARTSTSSITTTVPNTARPSTTPATATSAPNADAIPARPFTSSQVVLSSPPPHPVFNRFVSRAMAGDWPSIVVKPQGAQTATQLTERKLHRRWKRAMRRETRLRRRREKEERRAREKAKDPQWHEDAPSNPTTPRATTRPSTTQNARAAAQTGQPRLTSPPPGLSEDDFGSPSSASDHDEVNSLPSTSRPSSRPLSSREIKASGLSNSSEASATFAFHPSPPSVGLSAIDIKGLPVVTKLGLEMVLSNRAATMASARDDSRHSRSPSRSGRSRSRSRGVSPATREPFARVQAVDGLTPQQARMLGRDALGSHVFSSSPPFPPLDATFGTPMVEIGSVGFVQPLAMRLGSSLGPVRSASPDKADATASAMHAVSTRLNTRRERPEADSVLAPPFHYSDDFSQRSKWTTELAPQQAYGRERTRMAAEEWTPRERSAPEGVMPSTFPIGFPFTTSDRIRPVVSLLTAPSLVKRAEELGVIRGQQDSLAGSPPSVHRKLVDHGTEEKQQLPPTPAHPPSSGSAAWHAQRYSALPTSVSQPSVPPVLQGASFSAQMTPPTPARPHTRGPAAERVGLASTLRTGTAPLSARRSLPSDGAALFSSFTSSSPAHPPPSSAPRRPPSERVPAHAWGQVITQRPTAALPPGATVISQGRDYLFEASQTQTQSTTTTTATTTRQMSSTAGSLARSHAQHTPLRPHSTQQQARTPSGGMSLIASRFQVSSGSTRSAATSSPAQRHDLRRHTAQPHSLEADTSLFLHPAAMLA